MHSTRTSAICWTVLGLATVFAPAQAAGLPRPTVTIADGAIAGVATTVPQGKVSVHKYLGIPFAASPPVRFGLPTSSAPWKTTLDASAFKPACFQQFDYPKSMRQFERKVFNPGNPPESEDCLYLNVFTPSTKPPKGGRAVMFWIYGGNLQFGDAGLSFYDGSSFAANQDVIIVTTNYRTNAFGFSNSPEIPTNETNVGFFDQRMALDWVATNIHSFGGDPEKVTLFGESAGGYSVKQLLCLPPEPLNFRAVIMESEAALLPAEGAASWQALVAQLNCTTASSPLACVRSKPAKQIKSIIEHSSLFFNPVVDGITLVANVGTALSSGTAAPVPIFIGTNSQEGRAFATTADNVTGYIQTAFPNNPILQAAIEAAYPIDQQPYYVVSDIITDSIFLCPAAQLARDAVSAGHATWRYYFNASFPNSQPFPDAGVFHSSEIPLVFGTYPRANRTAQQVALSKYMETAWARFAHNPAGGPGWAPFTLGDMVMGNLGSDGSDGEQNMDASTVETRCPIFAALIAAEGIS